MLCIDHYREPSESCQGEQNKSLTVEFAGQIGDLTEGPLEARWRARRLPTCWLGCGDDFTWEDLWNTSRRGCNGRFGHFGQVGGGVWLSNNRRRCHRPHPSQNQLLALAQPRIWVGRIE